MSYIGWFGKYLLIVFIAMPLALLLLSLPSMLSMRLAAAARPSFTRDEKGQLKLLFNSRSRLPLSRLRLELEIENRYAGERQKKKYIFKSLSSGEGYIPLPTGLCGLLRCRITGYECRDLLGLFAVRRKGGEAVKCVILPKPQKSDEPVDIDAAMNTAVTLKPKYGGGYSEEHDLREYRPGDTVNSIHWKLSSKTDDVIVREPLVCENNQVFLVLSHVGAEDRGLETLYWLSLELCRREIPHIIVSDRLYPVGNESEAAEALSGILSLPMSGPCAFDSSMARCIFLISAGEVRVR